MKMSCSDFFWIALVIFIQKQSLCSSTWLLNNGTTESSFEFSNVSSVIYDRSEFHLDRLRASNCSTSSACGGAAYLLALNHTNLANLTVDGLSDFCRSTHRHLSDCFDHLSSCASPGSHPFLPLLTAGKMALASHWNICSVNSADQLQKFHILLPCLKSFIEQTIEASRGDSLLATNSSADNASLTEPTCLDVFCSKPVNRGFVPKYLRMLTTNASTADENTLITHEMCCRFEWTKDCMMELLEYGVRCDSNAVDLLEQIFKGVKDVFHCSDVFNKFESDRGYGVCARSSLEGTTWNGFGDLELSRSDALYCPKKRLYCKMNLLGR